MFYHSNNSQVGESKIVKTFLDSCDSKRKVEEMLFVGHKVNNKQTKKKVLVVPKGSCALLFGAFVM